MCIPRSPLHNYYLNFIVQDTGAPTTHDKPGSLTCPVLSTEHFFLGRTSTYLLLVILVGVRGDRTRNPWVGSRVFYH